MRVCSLEEEKSDMEMRLKKRRDSRDPVKELDNSDEQDEHELGDYYDDEEEEREEEEREGDGDEEEDPDGYAWRHDPMQPQEMTEMRHETWAPTHKLCPEELGVTFEMARSVADIQDADKVGSRRATFGDAQWEGSWEGGLPNGPGVMAWSDGTKYEGNVSFGQVTGSGKYEWADGGVYVGEVLRGKRHGRGTYTNGVVKYEGEWEDGHRHGAGTLWFHKEGVARYEGGWVRGRKHGHGVMVYKSKAVYEGEWEDDVRHGKGRMEWVGEGGVYYGEWHRGAQVFAVNSTLGAHEFAVI